MRAKAVDYDDESARAHAAIVSFSTKRRRLKREEKKNTEKKKISKQ